MSLKFNPLSGDFNYYVISANEVTDAQIRLRNNQYLRALNAAGSADINIVQVNASDKIEFASVPQVTSDASAGNDLVRKSQMDALLQLWKPKDSVRAATVSANVDLTTGGLLTIDDIVLVAGDRVLVKNQTDTKQNGIYVAGTGAWSRSTDMDLSAEFPGAYFSATAGTINAGKGFICNVASTFVLGTNNVTFIEFTDASKANKALDNLASVAINTSLVSDTNNTDDLGSSAIGWANGYINKILFDSNSQTTSLAGNASASASVNYTLPAADGTAGQALTTNASGVMSWATKATPALDNLASVAINTSLISDTDNTDDLGSTAIAWKEGFINKISIDSNSQTTTIAGNASASASVNYTLPAADGTAGQILSTNASGVTSWVTRATPALDNLASVAINTSLVSDANNTDDLGSAANGWANGYINKLYLDSNSQTTTIAGSSSASASVNYVLPAADGSSGQVLSTNASGVMSWVTKANRSTGDIDETNFAAANNVSSWTDITSFAFANTTVRSFKALVSVTIDATSDLFEVIELSGIQRGSDWVVSETRTGDASGLSFSITAAGQVQYKSTDVSGFVSNTMKFRATTTSV